MNNTQSTTEYGANLTLLPREIAGQPEVAAMLQAYYSRSPLSIRERLRDLSYNDTRQKTLEDLKKWYVNYSHKSIAQTGTVTLFIEGVSFLCAKAFQSDPQYQGQESSSRYLDFGKQDPNIFSLSKIEGASQTGSELMSLYENVIRTIIEALRDSFYTYENYAANNDNPTESKYNNLIKAFAFDIGRGFLPAGCRTQLSVTMNMDAMKEHLVRLYNYHPLPEVRGTAESALQLLHLNYPSAFADWDIGSKYDTEVCYYTPEEWTDTKTTKLVVRDNDLLGDPMPTPPFVSGVFNLDFGSWRDIQRHRPGVQAYTAISSSDFNPWYLHMLSQYDQQLATEAYDCIATHLLPKVHQATGYEYQYLMPMMFSVLHYVTLPLDKAFYMLKLRMAPTVHATLRLEAANAVMSLPPHLVPEALLATANSIVSGASSVYAPAPITAKRGDQTFDTKVVTSAQTAKAIRVLQGLRRK